MCSGMLLETVVSSCLKYAEANHDRENPNNGGSSVANTHPSKRVKLAGRTTSRTILPIKEASSTRSHGNGSDAWVRPSDLQTSHPSRQEKAAPMTLPHGTGAIRLGPSRRGGGGASKGSFQGRLTRDTDSGRATAGATSARGRRGIL